MYSVFHRLSNMKQIRKRTYFRLTKKKGGNQDSPGSNMFLYLPDVMIAKLTYLHSELFLAKPTDWPTECWPNKMEKKSIVDDCDFIPSSATMLLTVAKIINWWKSPSYTPLLSTDSTQLFKTWLIFSFTLHWVEFASIHLKPLKKTTMKRSLWMVTSQLNAFV